MIFVKLVLKGHSIFPTHLLALFTRCGCDCDSYIKINGVV